MILLGRALPLVLCHWRPARCCYLVGYVSQRVDRRLEAVPIRWAEVWAKLLLLPQRWERYTQPRWMIGQLLVVSLSTNWWVFRWGWRCNQSWTFDCPYRQPSFSLSNLQYSKCPLHTQFFDFLILLGLWVWFSLPRCVGGWSFSKRLATDVAKAIFGLVSTIAKTMEPIILWYFSRSMSEACFPLSFGTSWIDSFMDVFVEFAWSRRNFWRTFSM